MMNIHHYSAPEIPIYIPTRGLPCFAIHAVKICQTTPLRPCSTLKLVLQAFMQERWGMFMAQANPYVIQRVTLESECYS